ncbi:hypothetical protein MPLB_1690052 [Mesorhizobium sp. ORS 3324]|nr:hypothetical protein MPLB_1690052 [Mesorhizobium sp. ORS 3324]
MELVVVQGYLDRLMENPESGSASRARPGEFAHDNEPLAEQLFRDDIAADLNRGSSFSDGPLQHLIAS